MKGLIRSVENMGKKLKMQIRSEAPSRKYQPIRFCFLSMVILLYNRVGRSEDWEIAPP